MATLTEFVLSGIDESLGIDREVDMRIALAALIALAILWSGDTAADAGQPAAGCPIAPSACAFAARLNAWLLVGNFAAVVAQAELKEYECDGPVPRGLGGPYPLCDGAAAGERRSGYVVGRYQSEGGIASAAQYIDLLRLQVGAADPALTDEHGPGRFGLYTLGCRGQASGGDACAREFTVVFSYRARPPDFTEPARFGLMATVEGPDGGAAPRITYTLTGFTFPPQAYAGGDAGSVGGSFQNLTFYPWTPPAAGTLPAVGTGLHLDTDPGPRLVLTAALLVCIVLLMLSLSARRHGAITPR